MTDTALRKIIHIDMDCFYAAIEARDNPALRGKALAVGGSPDARGVVATCSYEARKFGVHSAMPMKTALRLCPELIRVPPRRAVYQAVSEQIHTIFAAYTELIEPLSLDEAYLDVSKAQQQQGSATLIAQEIRARIWQEQQLTASAGIAPNKFLAKVASDWHKPNGQFVIRPQMIAEFMLGLPVKKIPGVGTVTAERMGELGVRTCADLQTWSVDKLCTEFGRFGKRLYELARGIDHRPVSVDNSYKSISVEDTFATDLPDLAACYAELPALFCALEQRLAKAQASQRLVPKSLVVKIRFHDFMLTTTQTTTSLVEERLFLPLIKQAWERRQMPVRLLGIGVHFAEPWKPEQLSLGLK
ncbi:DNA polymerase IV [uncultured Thiothrix sp.]|uniref:DNA polymerase IV n=1 Tax=uncultured Thiothrix sp. TaxID=223185 RepID=UPI0026055A91|nr:DNA polymerase IV [uncultured Thiothrix sp.]